MPFKSEFWTMENIARLVELAALKRHTAAELGERVPKTDNGQPEDRAALLDAFAALFDHQNAVIREYQAR